jgi:DNA-binding response OmpR family regulator
MDTSAVPRLSGQRAKRAASRRHRSAPTALRSSTPSGASAPTVRLRLAVLDRDSGFLLVLAKRLERLEWEHEVLDGKVTADAIGAMRLDALIVDFASLGPRRWEWLERLCAAPRGFGIVICSGSSTVAERVRALRLGADEWLGKPCHPEELIARVEAVVGLRRRPELRAVEPVTVGEVEIRRDQYQAFVGGSSLKLTRREFQLIELLACSGSDVLERELIYESLWGYDMARNDRSVDVFVHKLRRKLKRASPQWDYIHTHFRLGYRFAAVRVDCGEPLELTPSREHSVPLAA